MGTDNEIFKLRIKDILSDKNMTSKELAEKMGKAPQYVSNIINGGKGASVSTLTEVAKALDFDLSYLLVAIVFILNCYHLLFDDAKIKVNTLIKQT